MDDNSKKVAENIKHIVFEDRDYDSLARFITWAEDARSFIIEDEDGQEYRVSVTKEEP